MFSHVVIGADDTEEAKKFYDATLGALGIAPGFMDETGRVFYRTEDGLFAITKPLNLALVIDKNHGAYYSARPRCERAVVIPLK